jgi:hypothetical protein
MAENDFWEEQLRNWVEQSSNKNSARALPPKTMSEALNNRSKVKRMSLLPYPRRGADGDIDMTDWVAPQVAIDLIESAQLPGQVYRGEKAGTPEEARKMAVDVNFGSALLGKAPAGSLASGVARRGAGELPVRPSRENMSDLIGANTIGGRVLGDEMVDIGTLSGGASISTRGQSVVDDIAKQMSGPDGYIERLVVDQSGNVVEGQHRLDAMRRLGIKDVPVTRIVDPTAGIDLQEMKAAIEGAGAIRSDHVNQIASQVGYMLAEAGGSPARVLAEYDFPKGFEKYFKAALNIRNSGDLPMDEASRMARAEEMGFDADTPLYHGTSSDIAAFDPALRGDATAARTAKMATWMTDDPTTARGYAEHSALSAPVSRKIKEAGVAEDAGDWDLYDAKLIEAEKLEKQFSEQRLQGQNIMPVYAPKVGQDRTIWNRGDVDAEGLFVKNMKGKSFDDTGVSDDIQTILQGARRDGYAGVKFLNLDDAIGMGARPATHVAVFNPSDIRSKHAKFDPAKRNSADLLASNPGDPLSAAAALQKQYEDEQLLKFLETGA